MNRVVGDIRTSPPVEDEHLFFRTPYELQASGSGIYNNEVQAAGEPTINIRAWREIINQGARNLTQTGRTRGFAESVRPNGPACFIINTFKTGNRAR